MRNLLSQLMLTWPWFHYQYQWPTYANTNIHTCTLFCFVLRARLSSLTKTFWLVRLCIRFQLSLNYFFLLCVDFHVVLIGRRLTSAFCPSWPGLVQRDPNHNIAYVTIFRFTLIHSELSAFLDRPWTEEEELLGPISCLGHAFLLPPPSASWFKLLLYWLWLPNYVGCFYSVYCLCFCFLPTRVERVQSLVLGYTHASLRSRLFLTWLWSIYFTWFFVLLFQFSCMSGCYCIPVTIFPVLGWLQI